MGRGILNRKGISMLEASVCLLMIAFLLSFLVPCYVGWVKKARYEKTLHEMMSIAEASIDYFMLKAAWPQGVEALIPQFMPQGVAVSPFGTIYELSGSNNMATVSVLIPSGIAENNPESSLVVISSQGAWDQIQVSQIVKNEFTSRLSYDRGH
ncbi:MAG: hypothetical protein HQL13_04830 [Candidatus Omnitrophica bacterium]|nr:hypothetical protein [Candidatus Omnitrophota bacterium]